MNIITIGNMYPDSGNPQAGRIYDPSGISPCLDTMNGGNRMPKIIDDTYGFYEEPRIYDTYSPTLRSRAGLKVMEENNMSNIKIRKLTPKECFRLMGFSDSDYKASSEAGISNSQLYKQAGNSIVVNVIEEIYKKLGEKYNEFKPES